MVLYIGQAPTIVGAADDWQGSGFGSAVCESGPIRWTKLWMFEALRRRR